MVGEGLCFFVVVEWPDEGFVEGCVFEYFLDAVSVMGVFEGLDDVGFEVGYVWYEFGEVFIGEFIGSSLDPFVSFEADVV